MSLLTLSDLLAAYKTVSPDEEWALGGMENANKFANAIEAAVVARLAKVSVEPIGWIRKTKNSRPEDVTVIDIRKEEADEWKSQFIPGFARSEPMYSAEALAAARVQAREEFKADLADALCADCENGVKSLNVKALEKFRNDYPTLSALIGGADV